MSGGIYLIQNDNQLVKMTETPYESESLLQELLAKYPSLLAGEQIDSITPRRWILISREMPIPDSEDNAGPWSLDHLFIDQDGIPTIVEVKRSNNTQIRREIVGQILDYAANAIVYWSIEKIRAKFEEKPDFQQSLIELLGEDETLLESFWNQVELNLQAGKIRLVFVADKIPVELQRIVEFLNQQMNPAEVLAVEIKQYTGQGLQTLVPRVIGKKAIDTPKVLSKKQWDELSFLHYLETKYSSNSADVAKNIFFWANQQSKQIYWGKGNTYGSFIPKFHCQGKSCTFIKVWTNDSLEILAYQPPFNLVDKKAELLNRLQSVVGTSLKVNPYCWYISLSTLTDEITVKKCLKLLLGQFRKSNHCKFYL
jgi:hypothetical protein